MNEIDLSKITVVVGLSGGVDSSVAALLLKEAGFNVRGVFMKCYWTYEGCQSDQDRVSAARVASELNIPFEVWDFEKEYRQTVVEYFYQEYQKGRTPNPDVVCNREIKFGLFLKEALRKYSPEFGFEQRLAQGVRNHGPRVSAEMAAEDASVTTQRLAQGVLPDDYVGAPPQRSLLSITSAQEKDQEITNNIFIATGHYSCIGITDKEVGSKESEVREEVIFPKFSQVEKVSDEDGFKHVGIGEYLKTVSEFKSLKEAEAGIRGKFGLYGGVDVKKDQSYFLYGINESSLEHILFPLGNLTKVQVRKIAREAKLSTADRPDSSGICFLGEVNVEKFLKERIKEHRGNVVDRSGHILGKHKGVEFYTVGQRHGFMIGFRKPETVVRGASVTTQRLAQGVLPDDYVGAPPQRSLLSITSAQKKDAAHRFDADTANSPLFYEGPWYVIGKNVEKNELVVGMGEECKMDQFLVKTDRNFQFSTFNFQLFVRIRNLGEFIPCEVLSAGTPQRSLKESSLGPNTDGSPSTLAFAAPRASFEIRLEYPVFGVAPGQSAVFYKVVGDRSLGGRQKGNQSNAYNLEPKTSNTLWQVLGGGVIEG